MQGILDDDTKTAEHAATQTSLDTLNTALAKSKTDKAAEVEKQTAKKAEKDALDKENNGALANLKIAAWATLQGEITAMNAELTEKFPAAMEGTLTQAVETAEYLIGEATNNDEAMAADAAYLAAEAAITAFTNERDAI